MTLKEIKPQDRSADVKATLEDVLSRSHHFDAVMVIAISREGGTFMTTNTASGMEKSFMISFANAWLAHWFDKFEDLSGSLRDDS